MRPTCGVGAFNVEIGAMMAPRPMLMVSATGDWTQEHATRRVSRDSRHLRALRSSAANVEMMQIDAPHNYNQQSREAVYRFFGKHVLGDDDAGQIQREGGARSRNCRTCWPFTAGHCLRMP